MIRRRASVRDPTHSYGHAGSLARRNHPLAERPQGSDLLGLVKPGDVIITPKLDRCFRSALDALDVLQKLKERGVSLYMIDLGGDVTGNGISKLLFTILSAVAEAERDRIRERITDVKRDQRQRGRYLGGRIPFGYRVDDDGALIEAEDQQAAIRDMLSMRGKGASLRSISEAMKSRGLSVSHNAVREITARARLDARIVYGSTFRGCWLRR